MRYRFHDEKNFVKKKRKIKTEARPRPTRLHVKLTDDAHEVRNENESIDMSFELLYSEKPLNSNYILLC